MLTLPERYLFALTVIGASIWFAWRIAALVRLVRMGKPDPDNRLDHLGRRIAGMLLDVFAQRRVFRKPIVGALHLLIVWGFFVFAVNTINHFAGAFIHGFNVLGPTRLALWYTPTADVFAVLIIVGVLGLAFRRHVLRPESLTRPSAESVVVFTFIGGAMAAYLLDNAAQMALGILDHPDSHVVSVFLARGFAQLGEAPLNALAHATWWCDGITHLMLVTLLFIPTKHLHLLAGPVNLVLKRSHPRGRLSMMDLDNEQADAFGVSKIEGFTWKQNLDLLACIECGRCQDYCPTYTSEKPLNPKKLIVDLKHHLLHDGPLVLKSKEASGASETAGYPAVPAMIGEVVDIDAIWACTTCASCVEHCPMAIEHIDKLVDMRRHLVLMEARFPQQADGAFRNMETTGNPWGFAPAQRAAWAEGLGVPLLPDTKTTDVLYWVGCSGCYDDRCKKISAAMVKILHAAQVDFAILGERERCHCESARRLGNEYLYQTAAREVIETLKEYEFQKILVTCPHCFNTFANEFPSLGADYPVVHHARFILELIRSGRLGLTSAGVRQRTVALHDSCYLARYNDIINPPRQILKAAGRTLVRVPREGRKSFCCGAGGGRMWLEETLGKRINVLRARELVAAGAQTIATACPFCMTMLTDGLKADGAADREIKDIAEIVAESLLD